MREPPSVVYVGAALVALFLAVREARRVRRGDMRARGWFVAFLTSAAVFSIFVVERLSAEPPK